MPCCVQESVSRIRNRFGLVWLEKEQRTPFGGKRKLSCKLPSFVDEEEEEQELAMAC